MNSAEAPTTIVKQEPSGIRMVAVLGLVAALSGLMMAVVYQGTLPYIEANRVAAMERAVFEVLPGAARREAVDARLPGNPAAVYAGLGEDGRLVGYAIPAAGQGYQDTVRILIGYDPAREALTGMTVLESKETPGLGSKIGSDPDFLANFAGLDAAWDEEARVLVHPVETVKPGEKTSPWQIDGIAGATISSQAVGRMVGQSLADWLPVLRRHYEEGGAP